MIKLKAKTRGSSKIREHGGFRWHDKKRGETVTIMPGQEFEIDDVEEKENLLQLLQGGYVTVEDDRFLPVEGTYIACRPYAEKINGQLLQFKAKEEIRLTRDVALDLLLRGFVNPARDKWNPRHIMRGPSPSAEPKKLFDEEPPRENWITKGVKR